MSPILEALKPAQVINALSYELRLTDGQNTTVHLVRYDRSAYQAKLIVFDEAIPLLDWCQANNVEEALVGGFFLRESNQLLGETWVDGELQSHQAFLAPWHESRGSLHIDQYGKLALGYRHDLPRRPSGSLLQAGPLLISNRVVAVNESVDSEGFSAGSGQFDSDITNGRYPRAAIGLSRDYIWSVACDGRSRKDAGLSLTELAQFMHRLGVDHALNLDGGSSATQISNGALRNRPRADDCEYLRGRPIYSALVFETT